MGAVQKLATVVIIGLTALATLLVLSWPTSPTGATPRPKSRSDVAIERGIETYITYCLVCHGPAGEGSSEIGAEGLRIGKPIGGNTAASGLSQPVDRSGRPRRARELHPTRIHGG